VKRIVFVGQDQAALDRHWLTYQPLGAEWDLRFVCGFPGATAELESSVADVVVCEVLGPASAGAEFLAAVRERWPDTVRLVLTGSAAVEASLRVLPVAHQSLREPCDCDTFRRTLRRVLAVRDTLISERVRATIGALTSLPHPPRVYTRLLAVLADPDYGMSDVARVIETEASLVAKILQLVNSAFFGRPRTVTSVRHAVGILGTTLIRNVTLASELADDLARSPHVSTTLLAEQKQHGQLVAGIAHEIARRTPHREDAFTAGLLHDVGVLIIAGHYPEWLERATSAAREQGIPFREAESKVNPVGHAEAGAYLMGLWALPTPIVEAVAYHHLPGLTGSRELDTVGAVHIADVLAHEVRPELGPFPGIAPPVLDRNWVESIGVADRLDEWRAVAARVAGISGTSERPA